MKFSTALLAPLQSNPTIVEIQVVGCRCIRLIHNTQPDQVDAPLFHDRQQAIDWIQEFAWDARARLDVSSPEAGGVTNEGWRWHAVIPPMSGDQPLLVMRRAQFEAINTQHFIDHAALLPAILKHFHSGQPMVIAGPTGAGKTSFMVALLKRNAMALRLVFLETIREIPALSPCWSFLTVNDASATLNAALRISPGRFVIGEMREGEMALFFAAGRTGHGGAIATMHGSSIQQIERRFLEAGQSPDDLKDLGVVILARTPLPTITSFSRINLCDRKSS